MGLELLTGILGTIFAIPVAWKLLDEFFKASRSLRESDKASRLTIDNHIDHLTQVVTKNTEIMTNILEKSEENQENTKESRKELKATLVENTKASTMQITSNENVNETLKELIIVVREKL